MRIVEKLLKICIPIVAGVPMIEPLFRDSTRSAVQLLRERKPVYAGKKDLVGIVQRAKDDEVALVDEALLPENFYSGQNFLKRGLYVHLALEQRIDAILEKARLGKLLGPSRTRNMQFSVLRPCDYAGYAWSTLDGKELRHVLLTYCIEGSRLWNLCTQEAPDAVKVRDYHSKDESPRYGWTFDVEVPSFSGKGSYIFKMVHVAIDNVPEQHLAWRAMKSEGHTGGKRIKQRHEGCEFKYYAELTHRRPVVVTTCLHEVIAHRAISEWAKQEKGYTILQPYALPSQGVVDFYKKLCTQTLMEEKKKNKKGFHVLQRRFLSLPEIENVLWQYVVEHQSGKPPFYATSLLRDYNW